MSTKGTFCHASSNPLFPQLNYHGFLCSGGPRWNSIQSSSPARFPLHRETLDLPHRQCWKFCMAGNTATPLYNTLLGESVSIIIFCGTRVIVGLGRPATFMTNLYPKP